MPWYVAAMTSVVAERRAAAADASTSASYRAGLDGLRAIAVLLVLLFHLDRLSGGNLGVDLFFAISGWLITWRLLAERDRTGGIALGHFWAARVRRLMPAALTIIAAVLVCWRVVGIDVPSLRRDALFATFWASNWGTISGGGDYWARFGEPSPLTHFWSLAIEEQFYLVWPLLVVGVLTVLKRRPRAVIAGLAASLAVVSIVLLVALYDPANPTAAYMNTFTRAHSLLIGATAGALTALRPSGDGPGGLRGGTSARRVAPLAALVVVVMVAASSKDSEWLFRWGFPVFAVAATVVVVAVADGLWAPALTWRPLRWLGDRSYGIYLWHWPVILLLSGDRFPTDGVLRDLVRVACSLLLADLSYRFVEQPIRSRRRLTGWRGPAATVAALGVVTTLALTLPVSAAPTGEGSVVTLPPAAPVAEVTTTATASTEAAAPASTISTISTISTESTAAQRPTTTVSATTTTEPPPRPPRVLVAGDSTAVHLAEVLLPYSAAHPDEVLAGSAAFPGCGLSAFDDGRLHQMTDRDGTESWVDLSGCVASWDSIPRRVASDERFEIVLMSIGPWDATDIRLADGRVVNVLDEIGRNMVSRRYAAFVAQVEAAGAEVVWITPPDVSFFWGTVEASFSDPARWAVLRSIIDDLPVEQIDLPGWLEANGLDGPEGRPDGVHLAPEVDQRVVSELVVPQLIELRAR
jgi:peptidoglycan/LPS O-acetylase OafA/YrhL